MNFINSFKFPFLMILIGSLFDYITTQVGLGIGYIETHPNYSPLFSIMIFTMAISVLSLVLPNSRNYRASIIILSVFSFLGAVNNTLVILGLFNGLVI